MVDMINLFKKKSSIWALVVIAFIVFVGAFVIVNGKNPDDKTNKVSANANTSDNTVSNTSSSSNQSTTTNNTNKTVNDANSSSTSQTTTPPQKSKPIQQPTEQSTPPKATAQPPISSASQKYVSNNLGFSITFPASWKNKYSVIEDNNGLAVYFKPVSHPVAGAGLLFRIVKKTPNLDEGMLDTINGAKRYFTAKGTTFVIGGPTDVNFPENNPEFGTYRQLSSESASVINTIENTK